MICPNCNREVTPLVLRKGLACSNCLELFLDGARSFAFTKENDETFHLSEAAFYRGIKEGKGKYVKLAIELCRKACDGYKDSSGSIVRNPEAYVRMGYYYEKNLITEIDGKDAGLEKSYRIMIAYEYYSQVCNGTLAGDPEGHKSFTEVQKYAADRLLRMLADFSEGEQRNPRYSVKRKQEELAGKGLVDATSFFSDAKKQDVVTSLEKDLSDLFNMKTNVLIAVYRVRGAELMRLLPEGNETSCLYDAALDNDIVLRYYKDTSGQDKRSDTVSTSRQFKTFVEEVRRAPDGDFVLLFYNGKLKPILKGWDGETVKNELLKKSGAIDDILEKYKDVSRFTFYEDDVYYCLKKDKRALGATFKDYVFKGEIVG